MKHITIAALLFLCSMFAGAQTLSNALDATNLIWTTGGAAPWTGQTISTYDSVDAAKSGLITHSQVTWLQTTVVGPGTISFWWKVFSCPDEDYLKFYLADSSGTTNLLDSISGEGVLWSYRRFDVPAGTNTLRWSYEKDDMFNCNPEGGWVDQVTYTTNAPPALDTALNAWGYDWTTGGNSNPTYWQGQSDVTHDGALAARSGAVYGTGSDPQESWMQTTVTGATNVSFWWKVSSAANQAVLEFYIGETKKMGISGEVNWSSNSFAVPAGHQTLRWRYNKAISVPTSLGADRGWVDQVTIGPYVGRRPPLRLTRSNNIVILDWPVTSPAFEAQQSSNLTGVWTAVTQSPGTVEGHFVVSVPMEAAGRFFRVRSK